MAIESRQEEVSKRAGLSLQFMRRLWQQNKTAQKKSPSPRRRGFFI
jgi:hypothetical protein